MTRAFLIIGFVCLTLIAALGWILLRMRAPLPRATISFIEFASDTSGARLATFAISNSSPTAILRQSNYTIQAPQGNRRWTNLSLAWLPVGSRILQPNEVDRVSIAVPTNQPSWRVSLTVSHPFTFSRVLLNTVAQWGRQAGLPIKYRQMGLALASDWISEPPQGNVKPVPPSLPAPP